MFCSCYKVITLRRWLDFHVTFLYNNAEKSLKEELDLHQNDIVPLNRNIEGRFKLFIFNTAVCPKHVRPAIFYVVYYRYFKWNTSDNLSKYY